MKKLVFPILGLLMLGLSSCVKPADRIESFILPGFVDLTFNLTTTLRTSLGQISCSELQDVTDLMYGDAVVAEFSINWDQQPSKDYKLVNDFYYEKVDIGGAAGTTGGDSQTGDFTFPIENFGVIGLFEKTLFIVCVHKAPEDQKFSYEMTYDRDVTSGYQILKIRAKKVDEGTEVEKTVIRYFAFRLDNFFENSDEEIIKYQILFKTGVDSEGKDKYDVYQDPRTGDSIFRYDKE